MQVELDAYRERMKSIRKEPDAAAKAKEIREEQVALMASQLELIRAELLPHQSKRIKQVVFQYELTKSKDANSARLFLVPKVWMS